MVPGRINAQTLIADAALLEQLITDGEAIVEGVSRFVDGIRALRPQAPAVAAPAPVAEPGAPMVWDTTPAALAQYDGAHLKALRLDHAAVDHDPSTCHVCQVLETRLGSARP